MIPIEDSFEDVLAKAMRGHGLSPSELACQAGCTEAAVAQLLSGDRDDALMQKLAAVLGLSVDGLIFLADAVRGPEVKLSPEILLHNTAYPIPGYEAMTVNNYSIGCPQSGKCWLIDASVDYASLKKAMSRDTIDLEAVFLTHTHRDHVLAYDELSSLSSACYAPAYEPHESAQAVADGDSFGLTGGWYLEARLTPGHSRGGMIYLLHGGEVPVAFVGDTLFCLSIGKVAHNFRSALNAIIENILSLPEETVLCPGHGPLTTVGFEKANNPFFVK